VTRYETRILARESADDDLSDRPSEREKGAPRCPRTKHIPTTPKRKTHWSKKKKRGGVCRRGFVRSRRWEWWKDAVMYGYDAGTERYLIQFDSSRGSKLRMMRKTRAGEKRIDVYPTRKLRANLVLKICYRKTEGESGGFEGNQR
jgi:hypothetical protein